MIAVDLAILAALIIVPRPSNRVGWLMMLIAFASVNPSQTILASLPGPPTTITPGLWLLLGVYILQADLITFMRASIPFVSAFHPVLALVDFGLGAFLTYQAWHLVREAPEERGGH